MSGLGKYLDVARVVYDYSNAPVQQAAAEVVKEAAKQVEAAATNEIKEIAQGQSSLAITQAVSSLAATEAMSSVARNVSSNIASNVTCALMDAPSALALYFPPTVAAQESIKAAVQQGYSSYLPSLSTLGYGAAGLTGLTALYKAGSYVASKLRASKVKAADVMQADTYGVVKDSIEFLSALDAFLKNPTVVAIIKALTPAQANLLLNLEKSNKGQLATIAALEGQAQVVALQRATTPVVDAPVVQQLPVDLTKVDLSSLLKEAKAPVNAVMGTQAAPKASLVDTIMTSLEAKQVVDAISAHPKAKAVLEQLNEKVLKGMAAKAASWAPILGKYSEEDLVKLLTSVAAKCGQTIEVEAKKATLKV